MEELTLQESLCPVDTKFRKRPVEIHAFQMTEKRRKDNSEWPNWLHIAWQLETNQEGCVFPADYPNSDGTDELEIYTLEGIRRVKFGDWIIRGVAGELYPCKPEIFEATYEAALAPQEINAVLAARVSGWEPCPLPCSPDGVCPNKAPNFYGDSNQSDLLLDEMAERGWLYQSGSYGTKHYTRFAHRHKDLVTDDYKAETRPAAVAYAAYQALELGE